MRKYLLPVFFGLIALCGITFAEINPDSAGWYFDGTNATIDENVSIPGDLTVLGTFTGTASGNATKALDNLASVLFNSDITAANAAGSAILNEAATTTNPTLIPNKAELDTGWGWASDTLHAVLGGASEYSFSTTIADFNNNSLNNVKLGTLTDNGFVKTSGSDGTLSVDTSTYLTAETDPIVGAITGIPKADGAGNISAAVADTDYLTPGTASSTYALLGANADITSLQNAALYVGRDSDNLLNWGTDDHLKIKIGGVETDIVSISTGTGDNDKLVAQGYVDDLIAGAGDVSAASTITDNAIVRGDGGSKGVQQSGILIDDNDNLDDIGRWAEFNYQNETAAVAPFIRMNRAGAAGADVSDNDYLGDIRFYGMSNGGYQLGAVIGSSADGTPGGATDMPSDLFFQTSPDASATPVTRMSIGSNGNVGIGTTTPDTTLTVNGAFGGTLLAADPTDPSAGFWHFFGGTGDGTGDDGDIFGESHSVGGSSKLFYLYDHSAGTIGTSSQAFAGSTFTAGGDTSAGNLATIGYTAGEGLIMTGQGSSNDLTWKNDADTTFMHLPTGTTELAFDYFPVTPSAAPDSNYEVANKKYVDDTVGGGSIAYTSYSYTLGETFAEGEAGYLGFILSQLTADTNQGFGKLVATNGAYAGQTFTTAGAFSFSSLTISLKKSGSPTDNAIIEIYASDKTTLLGTSNGVAGSGLTTSTVETTFTWATPVSLDASTVYFLKATRSGALDSTNYYILESKGGGSSYAGGSQWYWDSGGTWNASTNNDWFFKFPEGGVSIFLTDADGSGDELIPIGYATTGGNADDSVAFATSGIVTISPTDTPAVNDTMYLSNTAGEVQTTAGSTSVKVGRMINATQMLIIPPPL